MEWSGSPEWSRVMGDSGPWTRHLAAAWQAAATEASDPPVPPRPRLDSDQGDVIAYWAPLMHLLVFGLGWRRPDLGLVAWRSKRSPLDEPILRLVDRWWHEDGVDDFLAWTAARGAVEVDIAPHGGGVRTTMDRVEDTPALAARRRTEAWQRTWGGGTDSMHLVDHLLTPLEIGAPHEPVPFDRRWVDSADVGELPRLMIVGDTYAGWYADFFHYMPGVGANGRSVRTDVVVKPVGWMGQFRQHKQTRLWFRGRSSVHLWGSGAH